MLSHHSVTIYCDVGTSGGDERPPGCAQLSVPALSRSACGEYSTKCSSSESMNRDKSAALTS